MQELTFLLFLTPVSVDIKNMYTNIPACDLTKITVSTITTLIAMTPRITSPSGDSVSCLPVFVMVTLCFVYYHVSTKAYAILEQQSRYRPGVAQRVPRS